METIACDSEDQPGSNVCQMVSTGWVNKLDGVDITEISFGNCPIW